jgi:hypothetical protein
METGAQQQKINKNCMETGAQQQIGEKKIQTPIYIPDIITGDCTLHDLI